MRQHQKILAAILCSGVSAAHAVYLDPDGLGQALIYPYYTTRSDTKGNPYNTYLSVTNTDSVGKAVRVQFLEGAASREVASFNVFLAPGDMWTGAVIPDGDGAKVITADRSCTEPAFNVGSSGLPELALRIRNPAEATDLAATREGFVQMIEMATVRAGSPASLAIAQSGGQGPANCSLVRGSPGTFSADLEAPRGALMGTLTLINVTNGQDATVNANALGALTTQSFFKPANDPVVDFSAPEITPVSVITTGGKRYRLAWTRGVDAVSSVLMQVSTTNEFVLDDNTASQTDWVITMPTRQFYRAGIVASEPFVAGGPRPQCDSIDPIWFDRAERAVSPTDGGAGYGLPPPPPPGGCYSATVWPVANHHYQADGTSLLGSSNVSVMDLQWESIQDGRIEMAYRLQRYAPLYSADPHLDALPTSSETDLATGISTTGAFRLSGLPILGWNVRTFNNGTLTCEQGACQGNYASAFPHHAIRSITRLP